MIVAVDSSVLLHLIDPHLKVRAGQDGKVPDRCAERLEHFMHTLAERDGRLIIPTPVLAEVLVGAGEAGPRWLDTLHGRKSVRIVAFDEMAAIECAALTLERSNHKLNGPRNNIKFDEQIVAIALVENCDLILAEDDDIRKIAPSHIEVQGVGSLELPPEDAQGRLFQHEADQK